MPRFYLEIKNILRLILLNVCVCVCVCGWVGVCVCVCDRERKRNRETDERKTELNFRNHAIESFSSSFIYLFLMPVQFFR